MKYGLDVSITRAYAHANRLADLAALAEEAGWDGFFVQDGLLNAASQALVDPWIALGAIALRTRRLLMGALQEIQEVLAYIRGHRESACPFDVVFAGETPTDIEQGAQVVQSYALAGVTWWLEGIWPERGSYEEMRTCIRRGPPRPEQTDSGTI